MFEDFFVENCFSKVRSQTGHKEKNNTKAFRKKNVVRSGVFMI